ncbi:MAG: hypothetical protein LBC67_00445 [Spirochaetales bacterium]|jgi:hypothetical protein|nr:hypothetical protein [Spirochaetales bacterium]
MRLGGKILCIFTVLLIFFAGGGELRALGSRDDAIVGAKALIVEKRYNEALLLLTDFIRREPDLADEAEELIRRILVIRGNYYDIYEELIRVLYTEKNVERALELIARLESLDFNPNPEAVAALARAKDSARFIYNQEQFTAIMQEALVMLNRGDYWAAAARYLSGFGMGRESFEAGNYGDEVEARVESVIQSVRRGTEAFLAGEARQRQAAQALLSSSRGTDGVAFNRALSEYVEVFHSVSSMLKTSLFAASALSGQNDALTGSGHEDLYLGYTERFITGRQNSGAVEGIKGAAERLLRETSRPVVELIKGRAAALWEAGRVFAEKEDWEAALRSFAQSEGLTSEALRIASLWYETLPLEGSWLEADAWRVARAELPLFLSLTTLKTASQTSSRLARIMRPASAAGLVSREDAADLRSFRESLAGTQETLAALDTEWKNFTETTGNNPLSPEDAVSVSAAQGGDIAASGEKFTRLEVAILDRIAAEEIQSREAVLAGVRADYQKSRSLVEGLEQRVEESPGVYASRRAYYPREGLDILQGLSESLAGLEASTREALAAYEREPARLHRDLRLSEKMERARVQLNEIIEARARAASSAATARANLLQAERHKTEGTARLDDAQKAIAASDFTRARASLAAARRSFTSSLALQEDVSFRAGSDERLKSLDADMVEAQNRIVIAEVYSLREKGRSLYVEGDYDDAQEVLERAQKLWLTTHTEEEPEIAYWLSYVQNALLVSSYRSVLVTDPLYNEMNQLLSLARQNYLLAQDFISTGNRRDALVELRRADEKLIQVKKTFPSNQEASVLTLRVAFLRNSGDSGEMFRTMYNASLAKVNPNNRDTTQEAYTEIQDLQQINPNYPGIRGTINEIEILLGYKPRPPDQKALAEARRLYQQAYQIVARNDRAQFPIALEQLNRALRLDPESRQAVELKMRIEIEAGGDSITSVLSSAAEEQFRRAERHVSDGNFLAALAIVENLLRGSENRKYPPLLELKRRIESQL